MPIFKPGVMNPRKKNIIIMLYGVEGAYKTSTSLTANHAILLDFNEGSWRANDVSNKSRFLPDPKNGWGEFKYSLENGDFDEFDVLIVDTAKDMLMKYLSTYLILESPTLERKTGGLTMEGYGALGARFQEDFISKMNDKILVFIAHDNTNTEGDITRYSPDIPGATGSWLLGAADQVGFVEKTDKGGVSIKFENSNLYNSKDTAKIGNLDVPHYSSPEWEGFFQKKIIDPLVEQINQTAKKAEQRTNMVKEWAEKINKASTPAHLDELKEKINSSIASIPGAVIVEIKDLLIKKANTIGFDYHAKDRKFIPIPTPEETK